MYPDPNDLSVATITPEALELIGNAVLAECDDLRDGIEDGVLNDPLACDFDITELSLAKEGHRQAVCLSRLRRWRLLAVPMRVFTVDDEQLVVGFPPGAELGFAGWDPAGSREDWQWDRGG